LKTFAIIPVKRFENSKTRLSSILGRDERAELAALMLQDTLATLGPLGMQVVVVSADDRARRIAGKHGASFVQEEKDAGVNRAVALAQKSCVLEGAGATIVIPEDLPLLNAHDIEGICRVAEADERCIVICPSARYDGTNVLLRRPPDAIETHYDNNSYETHVRAAREAGVPAHIVEAERLMFDIDTPEDVAQLGTMEGVTARATAAFLKSRWAA
jgi:2-phospho-L-lactate guanylyltransferase